MNELLWILVGNTLFLSLMAGAAVSLITRSYHRSIACYEEERKLMSKLLKSAQDRIHAASLSDYLAIRDQPEGTPPRRQIRTRTDLEEAEIEERHGAGFNGGAH